MRGRNWRWQLGVLICTLLFSVTTLSWAEEPGSYGGQPSAWGITDSDGTWEVFCQSGTIDLDVRNLGSASVLWTDMGEETDRILVRAVDDDSMEVHFTLPGG